MKVIFVRHGETAENRDHRHQPEHTPLTIIGRKQAVAAGEKLAQLGVTHVISSPLVRTLQTASLIADHLDLIPSIDRSATELLRPRGLTGHGHRTFRSLVFYQLWYLGLVRTGESYRDLRTRIATTQANIQKLPPDATVVVVSHTVFINMFLAHMCRDGAMNPVLAARTFIALFKLKNTDMIELTHTPIDRGCGWVRTTDLNLS
jgi:broad specificity phosphatase PhoE